jgi:hypothetical protein
VSLLKAFLFSLLALMVASLLFIIIVYISLGIFDYILGLFTYPEGLIFHLFCSMGRPIWVSVDKLATAIVNDNLRGSLSALKFFVAPLIAAIVAGRVGEKRLHSFFGVFLTSIVSMIISILLMLYTDPYPLLITGVSLGNGALFFVVGGSLLNGLIYGLIAFFTTKRK